MHLIKQPKHSLIHYNPELLMVYDPGTAAGI